LGGEQIAHILARQAGVTETTDTASAEHEVMGYSLRIYKHTNETALSIKEALAQTESLSAVSLERVKGEKIASPSEDTKLEHGDSLLVLVHANECSGCQLQSAIHWSDKLLLGIPSIDAEHRVLVKYAEDFREAINKKAGHDAVAHLFDRLLEYTTSHFAREEALMQKRGYPKMEAHVSEHRRITREVMELNRDKRYVFPASVDGFLEDWIINHINHTDRQYVEYLKK